MQYNLCKTIYNTDLKCDFIVYHPEKQKECIVIECKWQQSGGSVDEKYPFLVENLKKQSPYKSIIILDGNEYKKGAENWLRKQADKKLLHIFNMSEFKVWSNKENL